MIEAIQVIRDVAIILSAIIVAATALIVCRVVLDLTRTAGEMRSFVSHTVSNTVAGVVNPVRGMKGLLLFIVRRSLRALRRA